MTCEFGSWDGSWESSLAGVRGTARSGALLDWRQAGTGVPLLLGDMRLGEGNFCGRLVHALAAWNYNDTRVQSDWSTVRMPSPVPR